MTFLDSPAFAQLLSFLEKAIAAGVGAWAAFRFQEHRESRKDHADRIHALREALFILATQRSYLLSLERQHLAPIRDNPARHVLLLPLLTGRPVLALDLKKLVFLIKLHESGDLISRLDIADAQFHAVHAVVEERSKLHHRIQQVLDSAKLTVKTLDLDQFVSAVGKPAAFQLRQMTDVLYEEVTAALTSNRACVAAIQALIRQVFPKERVPSVIDEPPRPPASSVS